MPKKKGRKSTYLTVGIVAVSLSIILGWTWHSIPGYSPTPGVHVIEQAFYEKRSDIMVEVSGEVVRAIRPVRGNESYQEFQMRLPNGQLLLVVHDAGLGDRVPLKAHDAVTVRGSYQWTELGGAIYGTQRDSSLKRLHGWIMHKGKKYQ